MKKSHLPNILVIMTDDHGQWASHCYGNSELVTPNMDFLAESGILMQNAFTTCPVCSPARASFFTGRLPSQHGIHDFISEVPELDSGWMKDEITLPQLLKRQNYQTALIGKWHCTASSLKPQPGFDSWVCYGDEAPDFWNTYVHRGNVNYSIQSKNVWESGYQTRIFARHAIDFLQNRESDRPFFLFFGPVNTHRPFNLHPDRIVEKYRQSHFWDIPKDGKSYLHPVATIPENHEEFLAQYYSAVTMVDDQIGTLLDYLEGQGILDNTLVVYTSDHGHMNGHHGLYYKGGATMPQNFYEEVIRVPYLLRWPDGLPGAFHPSIPFDHCDMFQTILDAAEVKLDSDEISAINSPGESLVKYFQTPERAWRSYQFCEYGNAIMISNLVHKLVRRFPPHQGVYPDEYINLSIDPRESANRIDDSASQSEIARLDTLLEDHFIRYEIPEKSARNMQSQPPCNGSEPWRVS